jgi:anthranilate phosphoribosyltransferase
VIQGALGQLLDGRDLSQEEARGVMNTIMSGEATPAQIGGFLVALRLKGETADEIAGCAEAMREHVLRVRPKRDDLVDTAGTGGDGANTWNISTAAALVAAAAGAGVAKHGNRAASSATGAADVLEALGFELAMPPSKIEESIDSLGFAFLFAQAHHPAMKHAGPVRRELAARTVFNVLGPLTNPAGARAQVVGVYAPEIAQTIAEALVRLDARRAYVVHGAGGIDELSPAGPNLVCEVEGGTVRSYQLDPEDLGIDRCDPRGLRGADPETNARELRNVVEGEVREGAHRDAVLLNAAGAIAAAGHASDLHEGLEAARSAIDSGAAGTRLDDLIAFSRAAVSE